jgi:hypothetical protein
MPPPEDMTELDRPMTRRDFRAELDAVLKTLATKEDLKAFATKEDLKAFATKEDLKAFATKEDLEALRAETSAGFADMRAFVEFALMAVRDDMRRYVDVMMEGFRTEFRSLYDWTAATTTTLSSRIDRLETRVTNLEDGSTS